MWRCWKWKAANRPTFTELVKLLEQAPNVLDKEQDMLIGVDRMEKEVKVSCVTIVFVIKIWRNIGWFFFTNYETYFAFLML